MKDHFTKREKRKTTPSTAAHAERKLNKYNVIAVYCQALLDSRKTKKRRPQSTLSLSHHKKSRPV
jgi:hypothetical protein